MYCPKCGSQLPDDAAFCVRCGNPTQTIQADEEPRDVSSRALVVAIIAAGLAMTAAVISLTWSGQSTATSKAAALLGSPTPTSTTAPRPSPTPDEAATVARMKEMYAQLRERDNAAAARAKAEAERVTAEQEPSLDGDEIDGRGRRVRVIVDDNLVVKPREFLAVRFVAPKDLGVEGNVSVAGGNNDVWVELVNEANYEWFRQGRSHSFIFSRKVTNGASFSMPLPKGTYYFVIDNRFSFITAKGVKRGLQLVLVDRPPQ